MISIIICSTSKIFLHQVQKSIDSTIGVDYEVLFHDNSVEKKGICEVYNMLAAKASFSYLCFVHEDIIFNTQNWGLGIAEFFKDENIGVVGVAGCKYKSSFFSGWYSGIPELDCENIIHQDRLTGHHEKILLNNEPGTMKQEVVCIDGVFICTRKSIWEQIKFNEKDLKGFHFYDIDFSLRAGAIKKIMVTYEIEIIHLTQGGDFGDNWVVESFNWHKKNKSKLPVSLNNLTVHGADKKVIKSWLDWLKNQNISWNNKVRWVYLQKLYLFPGVYYALLKFFVYKPLRLKYLHRLFK